MSSDTDEQHAGDAPVPGKHPLELWREREGLTHAAAATAVGVAYKTWWTILNGRALPQRATLSRIAQRTGVQPDNLRSWWVAAQAQADRGIAA